MKLYQNGVILTMNAAGERAGSMAVEGERIVRVGGTGEGVSSREEGGSKGKNSYAGLYRRPRSSA